MNEIPWDVFQKFHQNFIPTIPITKIYLDFGPQQKHLKTFIMTDSSKPTNTWNQSIDEAIQIHATQHAGAFGLVHRSQAKENPKPPSWMRQFFLKGCLPQKFDQNIGFRKGTPKLTLKALGWIVGKKEVIKGQRKKTTAYKPPATKKWWQHGGNKAVFPATIRKKTFLMTAPL